MKMKNKCLSIVMAIILAITVSVPIAALDGSNYDKEAPVLKFMKILNEGSINTDESPLYVELEAVEEESGIQSIRISLKNEANEWIEIYYNSRNNNNKLLFTGKEKLPFLIEDIKNIDSGKFKVASISLSDVSGNCAYYGEEEIALLENTTKEVDVIIKTEENDKKDQDSHPPILREMRICQTENVDPGKPFEMEFDIQELESGIRWIRMEYGHNGVVLGNDTYNFIENEKKVDGRIKIAFEIPEAQRGENEILEIALEDNNGNEAYYNYRSPIWESFQTKFTVNSVLKKPEIKSLKFENIKVKAPDLLYITMELDCDEQGIEYMNFNFKDKAGKIKHTYIGTEKILKKGKQKIAIPISPFFGEGDWTLDWVFVKGKNGVCNSYQIDKGEGIEFDDREIQISSLYEITYYGSVANVSAAVRNIKEMEVGSIAVLDCRVEKTAAKEIFEAIAGEDKTVVFEDEDVQWVFYGKKIKKNKCKDIDLTVEIRRVYGEPYGYADDEYILKMKYENNGELPGEVEMRVNYDYLYEKYQTSSKKLILTYYQKEKGEILDEDVKVEKDLYAEYKINHNSTYLLSRSYPRLLAPKNLKAKSYRNKQVKLSWSRVSGAVGYGIYRSNSSKGTYKKIGSTKGNKTVSYVDAKTTVGKVYYYRVKAKGNLKNTKASYSSKISKKAMPSQVRELSVSNRKTKFRIGWQDNRCRGFQVYCATSKNGKYKRLTWTRSTVYITEKQLKKGKTYYIKVRGYETLGKKVYYGPFSEVKKKYLG